MKPTIGQIELAIKTISKEVALRDVAFDDEEYREDQYIPEHFTESTMIEQKEAMRILIAAGFAQIDILKGTGVQDGKSQDFKVAS